MEVLDLSFNSLTAVPSDISLLPMLSDLSLAHNDLVTGGISGLGGALGLHTLNISSNSLRGIPGEALGLVRRLHSLDICTYSQQFYPLCSTLTP